MTLKVLTLRHFIVEISNRDLVLTGSVCFEGEVECGAKVRDLRSCKRRVVAIGHNNLEVLCHSRVTCSSAVDISAKDQALERCYID